jgi:hypothetical protein
MGVRTLHVTGLTLSGFGVDAAGRLQISAFGDDRSWKATLRVLALADGTGDTAPMRMLTGRRLSEIDVS